MAERNPSISKGAMLAQERSLRSKLVQLVSGRGLIRGTLSVREKVCGKATCKCARGERHIGLYLTASQGKDVGQLFIPKSYEGKVRQWIEEYKKAEALLEEISATHWTKIKNREQ